MENTGAKVTGTIKRIEEIQAVGGNGFELRNIVVTTEEQHSQILEIKFTQGRIVEIDKIKVGDRAIINVNLKGREYTKDQKTTVFNSIEGWKIEKLS